MEERFDALWDAADLASTERQLLGLQLSVKGQGDPYLLVQLLARVARAQTLQNRFEHAQETLNDIDFVLRDAARRLPGADPVQVARACCLAGLERARYFLAADWPDSARASLEQAQAWAARSEDPGLQEMAASLTVGL